MHLLTLNAAGQQLAPPRTLDPRRRRLSQVIGRHVDRSRPHMVAIQRARDPLQPIEEAWVLRGRDRAGAVKPWPRRYLPADAIVVVVYLPRGGGGASAGGSKKSPLNIALGIAAVALVAFSGPIGGALAGVLGVTGSFGVQAITAGLVLGGTALLSLASRSKANKTATDTTQIYGVAGGGNLPKPGDRIPRGYGRSWMKPDLSQPDFSQYDGDDQILFKRQTLGLGRYRPYALRAGKQTIWTEAGGFLAPFDDARNAVEFIYGTASTLVPNAVVSAAGVGGALPRPGENPSVAGPFLINQRGALVTRLQVDFQFPQGISRTDFLKSGATRSNQQGAWAVYFEYAEIDESGAIAGPWQVLYNGNSGSEGARFATHPLRYTRFKDVPAGRYAVRGRNVQPDTSNSTTGNATIDAAQWDAASGWVADAAIRPGITELCMRIYATKGSQAAAFGEIEVDAGAIIPVWTGSGWVEQETSKAVWAFVDIMRNQDYGGALPDSQIDLGTPLGYASLLTEFDTFDGTIRGPVSVYEAAATVLLPMRAEPVHLGRYWSLVRDEPKAVRRHVITPRQMLKGSTQLVFDLDTAAGGGHVIGEFDQDGDYRNPNQTTAIYGEASLTPSRQRWTGVRSYAHAQHLTRWRAASGAFRRQTAPFGVEMEGRIYKRGDSILVDPWFLDARRRAGIVDNLGDTLSLDADLTLEAGDAAMLRDRTGRAWGPIAIAGQGSAREIRLDPGARAAVEQATGQSLASVLSDGRREMTTVLVGPVSTLAENYLIQSVKPNGPDKAQVEALIDDPRVWAAIGAGIVVPPIGFGGLSDPEVPHILGLTANAVQMAAGLRLDYAIQPGRGSAAFEIGLSYDNGARFDTRANAVVTGSIDLNPVDPQQVVLRARAFGITGLPGPYFLTTLSLPEALIGVELPLVDREALADELRNILSDDPNVPNSIGAARARAEQAIEDAFDAFTLAEDAKTTAAVEIDKDRGQISQLAAASTTYQIDQDLTFEGLASLIRQAAQGTSDTRRDFAYARQNLRAGIDENGRAIATYGLELGSYQGQTNARFAQVAQTIADGDSANASLITALSARFDDPATGLARVRADVIDEKNARVAADSAEASAREQVAATAAAAAAGVVSESRARADGDSANAQYSQSIAVQLGSRFAGGRITFAANAAPSGVSARYAIELVSQDGNSTQGTGLYIDLNTDGTSAITLDARRVRFGNAGTGVYPFSYDDATQTLTIANLRITKSLILPGYANIPVRFDIANYTLASGQGTANSIVDANIVGIINVENNDYPTFIGLTGEAEVGASGSVIAMQLIVDGVTLAPILFGGVSTGLQSQGAVVKAPIYSSSVRFLSVGSHRAQILFSFIGGNANSYFKVNTLQFAGFTPRA